MNAIDTFRHARNLARFLRSVARRGRGSAPVIHPILRSILQNGDIAADDAFPGAIQCQGDAPRLGCLKSQFRTVEFCDECAVDEQLPPGADIRGVLA